MPYAAQRKKEKLALLPYLSLLIVIFPAEFTTGHNTATTLRLVELISQFSIFVTVFGQRKRVMACNHRTSNVDSTTTYSNSGKKK